MSNIKSETVHGVKWTAINTFANTGFGFLLGIVLARLLTPTDYGTVGMMGIFLAIANVLVDSGFSTALIRKKDATIVDESTVFFFNIIASAICCAILCLFSRQIAAYLNMPIIEDMIKVSALTIFIGSFGSVHFVLMTKAVDFKTPALIKFPISVLNGFISIVMAYMGYGAWALIVPGVASALLAVIVVWRVSSWRPKFLFSFKSIKEFLGFSGNLVANSIVDMFFGQGVGMLIGKYYSPAQLGFYSKGSSTAQMPSSMIYNLVSGVTLPVLSKVQDDEEQLLNVYSRFMRIMSMVIFFAMFLLIAVSKPLVLFLYTDKWLPAVIFLQLFCLKYMLYHINGINWNFLLVKGRTDWAFRKEIINKTFKIILMIIGISFSPIGLCVALIISSMWDVMVNTFLTGRLFSYGMKKQFADFMPYMFLAALCCAPAYAINFFDFMPVFTLIIQVFMSSVLYFGYLYIRRDADFKELVQLTPLKKYIKF